MRAWEPISDLVPPLRVFRVLTLEPLTLGHLRLFDELGIDISAEIGVTEAISIAFLCAQPHHKARRRCRAIWLPWFLRLVQWINRRENLIEQVNAVAGYIAEQLDGPEMKRDLSEDNKRGEIAAPQHLNLKALAMGRLNCTQDDADNLPVREARQLLAAYSEANGKGEFWSRKDEEFEQMCRYLDHQAAEAAKQVEQDKA